MSGTLGSIIGGVGGGLVSAIGGLISNQSNAAAQGQANLMNADLQFQSQVWNAQQAQIARDWTVQQMQQAEGYNSSQAQAQMDFQKWAMGQAAGYDQQAQTQAFQDNQWLQAQAISADQASQNQAQAFSTAMAQNQQNYETIMANTAYQRMVNDMKSAGLNPILGVASGGAPTPSVSAPTGSTISAPGGSVGGYTVNAPSGASGSISTPAATYGGSSALAHAQAPRYADVLTPAMQTGEKVFNSLQDARQFDSVQANRNADTQVKLGQADLQVSQAQQNRALTNRANVEAGLLPERYAAQNARDTADASIAPATISNLGAQAALAGASAQQVRQNIEFFNKYGFPPTGSQAGLESGYGGQASSLLNQTNASITDMGRALHDKIFGAGSGFLGFGGNSPNTSTEIPTIFVRPHAVGAP